MAMYDEIKTSYQQFAWEPKIEHASTLKKLQRLKRSASRRRGPFRFIVLGMGASHCAADLMKTWRPETDVIVWSSYGLPPLSLKELKEYIIIASSYSGNTEEVVDGCELALHHGLDVLVIASGGKLIDIARTRNIPCVLMPSGLQPRMALIYSMKGTLALMGEHQTLRDVRLLATTLRANRYEKRGKDLAQRLQGSMPVLYSSLRNQAVAYNWKIRLNETGKIPAYYNVFPETNHNEMISFDASRGARTLSRHFYFLFLKDHDDDPRITHRMDVMRKLFAKRGLRSEVVALRGANTWEKIFSTIHLADWTAYYTAQLYHTEPEAVAMVEEFKKLIAR